MSKLICFDLRPLQIGHENRGIGMVIISILENLEDNNNRYLFYTFDKNNPLEALHIKPKIKNFQIVTTKNISNEVKKPTDLIDSLKMQFHRFTALKPYRPDIFVQFDFKMGLPKRKNTQTIVYAYDLIPLIMKKDYLPTPFYAFRHAIGKRAKIKSPLRALYYLLKHWFLYKNYNKADKIISISESTTKSFIKILGINPSKITTIPLAPAEKNHKSKNRPIKIKEPYIFYVGGTDKRKRVDHVIFAYNIIRSRGYDLRLVLAGNEFQHWKKIPDDRTRLAIKSSPYKDDIILLGFVSEAEKRLLYQKALAFVFCSTYEGFGLPLVEAEANSCPVVSYNNSSIPEAVGRAALLVESNNYVEIANKTIELFDNKIRKKYVERGIRQARKFSWPHYTTKFLETLGL